MDSAIRYWSKGSTDYITGHQFKGPLIPYKVIPFDESTDFSNYNKHLKKIRKRLDRKRNQATECERIYTCIEKTCTTWIMWLYLIQSTKWNVTIGNFYVSEIMRNYSTVELSSASSCVCWWLWDVTFFSLTFSLSLSIEVSWCFVQKKYLISLHG